MIRSGPLDATKARFERRDPTFEERVRRLVDVLPVT